MWWELKQGLDSDWDSKQNSSEMIFTETKGSAILLERVGGEMKIPLSRKEYNSF